MHDDASPNNSSGEDLLSFYPALDTPTKMLLTQTLPRVPSRFPSISIPTSYSFDYTTDASPQLAEYLAQVETQFKAPLHTDLLRSVSKKLQAQFREKLKRSDICMLPAYKDSLPDGNEHGTSLAIDVGGSNLRVAWVRLCGRSKGRKNATQIVNRKDFPVTEAVRALSGRDFFAWIAKSIRDAASAAGLADNHTPLPLGMSWSFPVDQKSKREAFLLQMGKDFRACDSLIGENLADLLEDACRSQGLPISVQAVVNDSTASLLSEIYVEGSTSMAVILGTGLNAAIHLPSTALSPEKFGPQNPQSSNLIHTSPNVLVNTELSMFGKDVLLTTSWDDVLNLMHSRPDFQPLEHLTSGRYLGEIVRLIVVKAIQTVRLFDGEMPKNFGPYAFQSSTMATIERDRDSGGLTFSALHPLPSRRTYTRPEIAQIRKIITLVTDRATAYMATAIYALWSLKLATEGQDPSPELAPRGEIETACISCLGSILGKYPRFRERVQEWLDRLTGSGDASSVEKSYARRIRLEMTTEDEGALIGAAVAVALGKQRAHAEEE